MISAPSRLESRRYRSADLQVGSASAGKKASGASGARAIRLATSDIRSWEQSRCGHAPPARPTAARPCREQATLVIGRALCRPRWCRRWKTRAQVSCSAPTTGRLARKYGGGESGLARFLKDASSRIHQEAKARFDADECRFIDRVLSEAWNLDRSTGRNAVRADAARAGAPKPPLGWFDSLDGFGSLDPAQDVATPGITCLDGQTIHCQSAQSYTQWVPLHDVDSAETVCPIGHSDRPDSRYRTSTMELWATAKLHPAPLSRQAVERMTVERTTLWPGSAPSSESTPPEHDLPASRSAALPRCWSMALRSSLPKPAPARRE